MIITDIQRQKHNEKRFSVFVDGEYTFSLSDVDLLYYKLKIGEEISAEKLNEIFENNTLLKAKNTALKYLGVRMRSEKEITARLKKDELPAEAINKTLDFLKEYGYINDRKFAESFIKEKKRLNGWGEIRLKQELLLKGVSRDIIEELHELMQEEREDLINAAIEKKLKGGKIEDRKEEQRLLGYLCRRGFSYSDVKEALKKYYKNDNEDMW